MDKRVIRIPTQLFDHGQISATSGVLHATTTAFRRQCMTEHLSGHWGVVDAEDTRTNFTALFEAGRLLSAYPIDPDRPCDGYGANALWIITSGDRRTTTLLLPEEA